MAGTKVDAKAATSAANPKKQKSSVGAPSQLSQSSRKGKRAWRKNVDIEDIETHLEDVRQEEREYGAALHKQSNDQLFHVDTRGDEKLRKSLPRFSFSELKSAKVLAQRSAVPAVYSNKKRARVSIEDQERLLRMAKRPRKGPFNAVMDPTELGSGSAILGVSEAVKESGTYDPWASEEKVEVQDGLETVQPKQVKPPRHKHLREDINVPAVQDPHQGTSYNPPADAHYELLVHAHEVEERREQEVAKLADTKKKMHGALDASAEGVAPGMSTESPIEDEAGDPDENDAAPAKKAPERKTKQQRAKAAKLLAEKRALAEKAARKRLHISINDARSLRRKTDHVMSEREEARRQRRLALQLKLRQKGLVGQKLGKHKVTEGEVDVQLGDDLSESLRGLKVEGNLFRDRFLNLQQRALIEPRVRVLQKRRKHRIVEYEKHAWKKFQ